NEEAARQALRDRPHMRAEVSKRKQMGSSAHFEERALIGADGAPLVAVDAEPRRSKDGLTWILDLLLPSDEDPQKAPGGTSYHGLVEEVVRMRFGGETPEAPADDSQTGPRFTVSLKL